MSVERTDGRRWGMAHLVTEALTGWHEDCRSNVTRKQQKASKNNQPN